MSRYTKDQIDAIQKSHTAYQGMLALAEEAVKVARKNPSLELPVPMASMLQSTKARLKILERRYGDVL